MTTILHVEHDESLAGTVRGAFEAFGFPGNFVIAKTLQEAKQVLQRPQQHLDLVISDMDLPDGTGLDVVRLMRSNPAQGQVPILILAGRADAGTVSRAYALGANSYIAKAAYGRTPAQIVRTVYDHWLQDAHLPVAVGSGRTHNVIARATSIRARLAQQYLQIANQRPLGSEEGDFWIGVAQREGNLSNLLTFLLAQLGERELPADVLDDLEDHQRETLRVLGELEVKPPITEDDAFRYLLALNAPSDSPAFVRAVGLLFPVSPLALTAMLDAQVESLATVSAQILEKSSEHELRQAASQLRGKSTLLTPMTSSLTSNAKSNG